MFLNFFDVILKFFRFFFDVFFLCFVFLYYVISIFFAFLCFVVLCFVIDPNFSDKLIIFYMMKASESRVLRVPKTSV